MSGLEDRVSRLERRLARAVSARRQAEDLLEARSRELALANDTLKSLNEDLEKRIEERTLELEVERTKAMKLALNDQLTGLWNRRAFDEQLLAVAAAQDDCGQAPRTILLALDLDGFKVVNDTFGHDAGDAVLLEIGRRLEENLRPEDVVFRVGGDEFAVLLLEEISRDALDRVVERLIKAVARPVLHDGNRLSISTSVGISIHPDTAPDVKSLQTQADAALYSAKRKGKNRMVVFAPDIHLSGDGRDSEIEALRLAMKERQLVIAFQAIYDLHAGEATGVEALLRWPRANGTLVPPLEILDIAREGDLLRDLSGYVMERALSQFAEQLIPAGYDWLSVNITREDLLCPEFTRTILSLLDEYGLSPDSLCLEVTEAAISEEPDRVAPAMCRYKDAGLSFALDDFGLGYSNHPSLFSYPIRFLKIDRSLVADISRNQERRILANAMVSLGKALDLEIIAEGVESEADAVTLSGIGARYAQGFHFGRARSASGTASGNRRLPRPDVSSEFANVVAFRRG